jgi:uncharacterized membrane protein required for colicin V production
MPWIDALLCVLLVFGYRKGLKRGPANEAWRALNTLSATLLGVGFFMLFHHLFSKVVQTTGLGGFTSFLCGFGISFVVLRLLRKKMKQRVEMGLGEGSHRLGGYLGAVRMGIWSLAALTAGLLSPLRDVVVTHSQLAKGLAFLIRVDG